MSRVLRELQITVTPRAVVSALYLRPGDAEWLLVLGHGAGAGMRHGFMEDLADALALHRIATLRYQFPYLEAGRKMPDRPELLHQTVRSAVNIAGLLGEGLPLLAGGKSMGGRMTSRAQAERPLREVRGIVFFGFPLHTIGSPGIERAEHLGGVGLPMLFLQGTRDRLADLELLRPVLDVLTPRTTLVTIEEADHDFTLPRRSGRSRPQVCAELADAVSRWASDLL